MTKTELGQPISLRLPPALEKKLRELATAERRSLNAQLVVIVEKFFAEKK